MFVAMNTFRVAPGREHDFERRWRERRSLLGGVAGFREFALLKGDEPGTFISHSTWEDRAAFVAWTKSEAFVSGHRQGPMDGMLLGPPQVSLYEAVLVERPAAAAGSER